MQPAPSTTLSGPGALFAALTAATSESALPVDPEQAAATESARASAAAPQDAATAQVSALTFMARS